MKEPRFGEVIDTLLAHCSYSKGPPWLSATHENVRLIKALRWLKKLVMLGKEKVLPLIPNILVTLLPLTSKKNVKVRVVATKANSALQEAVLNDTLRRLPVKVESTLFHITYSSLGNPQSNYPILS